MTDEKKLPDEVLEAIRDRALKRDQARIHTLGKIAEILSAALLQEADEDERRKLIFSALLSVRGAAMEDALAIALEVDKIKSDDLIGTPIGSA